MLVVPMACHCALAVVRQQAAEGKTGQGRVQIVCKGDSRSFEVAVEIGDGEVNCHRAAGRGGIVGEGFLQKQIAAGGCEDGTGLAAREDRTFKMYQFSRNVF